jgi:hypothetical protein
LQEWEIGALHYDQVDVRPRMHRTASQGSKHDDPLEPRTLDQQLEESFELAIE